MNTRHTGDIENTILYRDIIRPLSNYSLITASLRQQDILRNGRQGTQSNSTGHAERSQHIANTLRFGHVRYCVVRVHILNAQNFQQ